jgi:hypothetical protein
VRIVTAVAGALFHDLKLRAVDGLKRIMFHRRKKELDSFPPRLSRLRFFLKRSRGRLDRLIILVQFRLQ